MLIELEFSIDHRLTRNGSGYDKSMEHLVPLTPLSPKLEQSGMERLDKFIRFDCEISTRSDSEIVMEQDLMMLSVTSKAAW